MENLKRKLTVKKAVCIKKNKTKLNTRTVQETKKITLKGLKRPEREGIIIISCISDWIINVRLI